VSVERRESKDERVALIALGSNLGDSIAIVRSAMDLLNDFSARPVLRSSLWDTTPVDCPPSSPRFVNAAVLLHALEGETPETLLKKLQAVEQTFGRKAKMVLNEPRPLDLDLIAFGHETRSTPELTLPHPRVHLRKFVLQPLVEAAPDFVLPGQEQSVSQLLAGLGSDERVVRIA
jgi:2-amino-4-hydroxy-6-hydroxymethyldihydropteridine diphosphokinase